MLSLGGKFELDFEKGAAEFFPRMKMRGRPLPKVVQDARNCAPSSIAIFLPWMKPRPWPAKIPSVVSPSGGRLGPRSVAR
ncbi:hypothetical protein QTH97_34015 [Variovorax sp. J22R24]|uniref:hypothetical protein n=1 Tax=Variovorax gracilis TaxID=3053502 RepID=UPI002577C010|nr:hypothetical protein [Variovorax sp. J22R24]MDM0109968.1 hypothetical protein [Variovorax sp. J22R24]